MSAGVLTHTHTLSHTHIEIDRSVNCVFNLQYTCAFIYKHVLISLHSFQDIYIKSTREMAKKWVEKQQHYTYNQPWNGNTLYNVVHTYVYTCLCTAWRWQSPEGICFSYIASVKSFFNALQAIRVSKGRFNWDLWTRWGMMSWVSLSVSSSGTSIATDIKFSINFLL